MTTKTRPPELIHADETKHLLASTEADALAWLAEQYGPTLDGYTVMSSGWMVNVGWDRDAYETKREFLADSGYTSWWEGCQPPADGVETAKCRPVWEIVSAAALTKEDS